MSNAISLLPDASVSGSWRRAQQRSAMLVGGLSLATIGLTALLGVFAGDYVNYIVMLILINVVAANGVNIAMGYCGLVLVGQAGFAAIGAYTTALLMNAGVDFLAALAAGAVMAGVVGFAIGLPALRLSPLYIAMVTFGFGQAVNSLAVNWIGVTGGPNGLAVPPPSLFNMPVAPALLYVMIGIITVASFVVVSNVATSRIGRAFIAVRESETAARSTGVDVNAYKMMAFSFGACLGGLSGGLYALVSGLVNPDAFVFGVSVSYVTMCVLGGLGTIVGPLLGAVVLTLLPEFLQAYANQGVISGVILLAFLVLIPRGIVPWALRRLRPGPVPTALAAARFER